MRGNILGVHDGRGVITLEDGRRLEFSLAEWRSPGMPQVGQGVDFLEENGEARAVFLALAMPAATASPALTPAAAPASTQAAPTSGASTAFTLGVISVCCLLLGFLIPIVLPTVIAFVVGVIGAGQARKYGDNTGLVLSRIGWITSLILLCIATITALVGIFLFTQFGLPAVLRNLAN